MGYRTAGRRHDVDQRAMQAAWGVLDGVQLPENVRRSIESAFRHANISAAEAPHGASSVPATAAASSSAGGFSAIHLSI